jgi:REP element-mobilizing transposase RayT
MGRKIRVEYAGAIYHVMNRGNRRQPIFRDDQDRHRFLETLAEVCKKTGWQVHALCLMRNHFHLVVETPQGNLVAGMKWFLGTYTGRFNRRHKLFGHLFSGRYKALKKELLRQMKERLGPEHYGTARQETGEARAEGIVARELKRRRWREDDLGRRAKRDAGKVALAARLRAETTVTVKWIADRLEMGAPGHVHHLLYLHRKAGTNGR